MKQKLAIVQALSHDPELLILDEPTLGLDPLMQKEFYTILEEERSKGRTVFLSSHLLHEVERICDRIGIVRNGLLVDVENVADLKHKKVRRMTLVLAREVQPEDVAVDGVEVVHLDGNRAELVVHGNLRLLLAHLSTLPVEDLLFPEATLEETFMQYYLTGEPKDEPATVS